VNGPIAQLVALTCHGNAFVRGMGIPPFFPNNSTCQFCESVVFYSLTEKAPEPVSAVVVANTPDNWFNDLGRRHIKGIRLSQHSQADPKISDRISAGFLGGGRLWAMECILTDGASELWEHVWQVGNETAADNRVWRVAYTLAGVNKMEERVLPALAELKARLRNALLEIHRFSEEHSCGEFFSSSFANALSVLDDPRLDIGYHKDLYPPGAVPDDAAAILKAAMSSWVFGGEGSWNDMSFEGRTQMEYDRVSDGLFDLINQGIEAAVNSSMQDTSSVGEVQAT
jgi:hypothetical protein